MNVCLYFIVGVSMVGQGWANICQKKLNLSRNITAEIEAFMLRQFYVSMLEVEGKVGKTVQADVCEDSHGVLYCPPGSTIKVISADFGRWDYTTCSNVGYQQLQDNNCSIANATATDTIPAGGRNATKLPMAYLQGMCDKHSVCTPYPDYKVLGDACSAIHKYLTAQFKCVSSCP